MSTKMTLSRVCHNCGNTFEARTTVTQCCSDHCAKQWYKKRKRAEKIQQSNVETVKAIQIPVELIRAKTFLTIDDTQQLLGISRSTIMRLIRKGALPCAKFGRRTLISRTHIDAFFHPQISQL